MKLVNEIAHVDEKNADLRVIDIEILENLCLLIEFSNGEKRIFDAKQLLEYPVYEKLKKEEVFNTVDVKNGVLVWDNGKLDVGVDFLYQKSEIYDKN